MAKTKTKTETIEEAVVVEETTNALTVAEKIASNLPAIPEVFFIDGEEFSVAKVQELQKEAEALLKKATPETYNSTAIWEEVKALKNRLVKMRTTPDNKRKELSKPFQDFVKEIKSKTDLVGNAAKSVQEKLDAALEAKENHELELARQEAEAKAKRTEQRKEDLRALGGSYDVEGGKFTFGYAPGVVVSDMQIMEYDDPSWANQYAEIKNGWDAEQARIEQEREKEEREKSEALRKAEEAKDKIVKLRSKILQYEGFVFNEGMQCFVKNGVAIHVLAVAGYSEEDWDQTIESANSASEQAAESVEAITPAQAPEALQAQQVAPEAPVSAPPSDPLASVIAGMTGQHEERVAELDGGFDGLIQEIRDLCDKAQEKYGKIIVTLVFDPEAPNIDIKLNRTFVRTYPDSLEAEAIGNVPQDKIKFTTRTEDGQLTFQVIEI